MFLEVGLATVPWTLAGASKLIKEVKKMKPGLTRPTDASPDPHAPR